MKDDIIYIDPSKIRERINMPFNLSSNSAKENVDWDLSEHYDMEKEYIIYTSLFAMIKENVSWEETDLYRYIVSEFESGYPKWGCDTLEACKDRGRYLLELCEDIRNRNSVLLQKDVGTNGNPNLARIYGKNDDIYVSIDRNGKILFANNGSHRFCIAKILGIRNVPARVYRRHPDWTKYKYELYDYCKRVWHGKVYQTLPHPDLTGLNPLHPNKRYDIIKNNTEQRGVRLLDIGSLFGYICYRGELDGYQCTAVEVEEKFLEIMRKLKPVYGMKYEIVDKSVFDIPNSEYEIVVAFNIFHHFLKSKSGYDKLVMLLKRLRYKEMFIQFHKSDETQMKDSYANYNEEEFAKFIIENSVDKTGCICIGEENGRKIYKIY